ncbi:hypothetical protein FSP39_023385 [Pinctada imbricata]|uniref:Transmembrane protein 26 n=1 Tax=Pinctada imbricata TaxID=66713 RepID=A0AA88Y3W0_PINIB|nr:hypothetical protein FSP39_023385 [Pinctada imbricata]
MAVWRVTVSWDNDKFWLMTLGNILISAEGQYTIIKNKGIEWKWFCPCFLVYLLTTLPTIWLLQISQMSNYLQLLENYDSIPADTSNGTLLFMTNTSIPSLSSLREEDFGFSDLTNFGANTWSIIVEESLVYLIVLSRWLLPRGEVTREALSDLLLDYLAIASDIMELFALFDVDKIRAKPNVTYAILTIWSISFFQFVPVMIHRRIFLKVRSPVYYFQWIALGCGEHFSEIFYLSMGIILQDGPFLVLRLWIILYLDVLTYSLMFFVVKNIAVILLLVYKLSILCSKMPCCHKAGGTVEDVVSVDFSHPVDIKPVETIFDVLEDADVKLDDSVVYIRY